VPNLVLRRLLPACAVAVAALAIAGGIAASRPSPATSDAPAISAASVSPSADASCNAASCEAAVVACPQPETAPVAASAPVAAAAPATSPARAGMVAHLDPETGVIGGMPPAGIEDARMVERKVDARTIDAIAEDGSPMQITNGVFDEFTVVRLDARGTRRMACGPDAKTLLAAPFEEK
jgi:hypothetical protein